MHDYNLHCFLTKVKVLNQKHLINGKVLMASKIKTSSSKIKTKVAFLIVLLEIEFQFAWSAFVQGGWGGCLLKGKNILYL
jgi:hypothetical protein